ncbi:major facilitator superfamily domain-containing protein [Bombardia bombarda]|uniref:Major facilitator superfamily domain-containing protein n=1 Tax=Bombardia bombarda TaxID=252184 RepID=A0AA40CEM0_9PEZI|nr:major facilitator superfamily domain-containing protein [Bombardia bombarda]
MFQHQRCDLTVEMMTSDSPSQNTVEYRKQKRIQGPHLTWLHTGSHSTRAQSEGLLPLECRHDDRVLQRRVLTVSAHKVSHMESKWKTDKMFRSKHLNPTRDLRGPTPALADYRYPTYKTRLTELPEKKHAQVAFSSDVQVANPAVSQRDSAISRDLTRNPTMTTSLDRKMQTTVKDLENLLNAALVLANEVVDREDHHQRAEDSQLIDVRHRDASWPPPSVHDIIPSAEHLSIHEQLNPIHADERMVNVADMTDTATSKLPIKRIPKHYRSVPGMHNRNVAVSIPKRTSSLFKSKIDSGPGLPRGRQRDRVQEQLGSILPPSRQANRDRSSQELLEQDEQDFSRAPPSPIMGCLPRVNLARKIRSCGSCSMLRANHRTGFLPPNTDGAAADDARYMKEDRPIFLSNWLHESNIRNSGSWSFDGANDEDVDWSTDLRHRRVNDGAGDQDESRLQNNSDGLQREDTVNRRQGSMRINLRGRSHVSIRGYQGQGFSLSRAYQRHPVARDWSTVRKRFVATIACLSTAMIGMLIGIYAGLVPSIQYWIADLQHYAILGNVFFYLGLAIPTFFFWPLPLLHGRKPYILSSLIIAMPLLFPQAICVSAIRSPYVSTWRWALLSSRAFMGLTLGFASMNFHSMLTDLFGASLVSGNPHQEIVDKFDVRRHGGGMGVWLGIWTWCYVGSLGVGFLIGAAIINSLNPSWGFYVSIILIALVLLLNVVMPEVRRSPFRRSVAEVRNGNQISRRVARGEVKMHRVKDGPTWWGQEVYHGILLSLEMLRQPGFIVMALYVGWIYAQIVLVIVLLGSLTSKYYRLKSPLVGLCVCFVSIGALVAVPFQKANLFSRGRREQLTSANTLVGRRVTWTSHLLRRVIFCVFLPLVGIAYTVASGGPDVPVAVPTFLAALIGFLSGLAISECNGFIMETFDTSDLQPSMTGRPRGSSSVNPSKRTNYSSFPRVTAGFAICHTIGFILAAVATGVGGVAQRHLGQRVATGVVAGILLILTLLLLAVLVRFKEVQIIPISKSLEMEKWTEFRRQSIARRASEPRTPSNQNTMTDEDIWRPILIGNPSDKTRRVNILELGAMTRWTEIRKKNRLIDEMALHLNRAALESAAEAVGEEATRIGAMTTELVRRVSSRRSNRNAPSRRYRSSSPGPSGTRGDASIRSSPGNLELDRVRTAIPVVSFPDQGRSRRGRDALSERDNPMGPALVEENEVHELDDLVSSESDHVGGGPLYSRLPDHGEISDDGRAAKEYRRG